MCSYTAHKNCIRFELESVKDVGCAVGAVGAVGIGGINDANKSLCLS